MNGFGDLVERALLSRSTVYRLTVTGAAQLTPHMRRITFEGSDLARLATDDNLHLRLLLPPAGAPRPSWLDIGADGRAGRSPFAPIYRKYTIRGIDPAANMLSIDFVLHGDTGPGSAWAAAAQPGDVVGAIGPGGLGTARAQSYLIAGDEAALPAIGRILEFLPASARGEVFVEVADTGEEQKLSAPAGMAVNWLHRNGAPGGTTTLLTDAIRSATWPDGASPYVWVAAEAATIRNIRQYLDKVRRLPRSSYLAVAYWRRT